ncbi:MAG TPA: M20/M25/M40 family metallo-hydrolase [Blastocatellia bacterium]|jgi:acetylornithine deacetylase/succinyl-diaminopimelate desuccinylase-like protein
MKQSVLAVCLVILSVGALPGVSAQSASVRAYRESKESEILGEFVELLSIPNNANDTVNIRRNADWLVEMLRRRGVEARLLEGSGPPSVYGEIKTQGATRTIGFYAHYDGQAADATKWASDPFKPVLRDKPLEAGGRAIDFPKAGEKVDPEARLYARSASDDKAPIIALMIALDALKASGKPLTSNIKFLFEGEEEAGSLHLEEIVKRNAGLLKADAWICADGPVHQTRRPLIYFGVRGVVTATITVYGPDRGLHSGHYGNWAPNPAMRLARLLASMKDDAGRVLIDGFYSDAEPLGEEEKKALKEMPDIDRELMREYGLAAIDGGGRSLAELLNEPSLNIDGIRSEYVGRESRTIIPSEATATIDLRLVKGIDPRRQVERVIAHIKKQGYFVTTEEPDRATRLRYPLIARVTSNDGYRAVRTSMSLPISKQIVRAVREALGAVLVLAPTLGGSVPLYILESGTGSPQIGVPIVNHDNNQHSINENVRIKNLWDGIETFAAIMTMK